MKAMTAADVERHRNKHAMNSFDECRGRRTKQTTQPLARSMTCSTHSTLGSLVAPRAGIRQAQYAPSLQAELALSIEPPQRRLAQPRTAATLPPQQHSTFVTVPSDDPQPNEAGCCAHRGRPGWVATLRQRAARLRGAVEAVAGAARQAARVGQAGVPDGACATSTPACCERPFASADGSRVVTHWRQRDWQAYCRRRWRSLRAAPPLRSWASGAGRARRRGDSPCRWRS